MKRATWEEMFMVHAILSGVRSSCLIRRCGAVLVRDKRIIASGYNGAPPNVETCLDTQVCFYQGLAYQDEQRGLGVYKDLKEQRKEFCTAVHAEKNAINQCSIHGVSAVGSVLYSSNFPCPSCVRDAILPNGIVKIVVWKDYLKNPLVTMDEFQMSKHYLDQAEITVSQLDLPPDRFMEICAQGLRTGDRLEYQFHPDQLLT